MACADFQDRLLDEVRKRRDSELASLDAARSSVDSAESEVQVTRATLRSAQAEWEASRAETDVVRRQRDELDVMLDFATLKAPFDGVVTERNVDPGDFIRGADDGGVGRPLYVFSQIDPVRVRVAIPEREAAWVSRGDAISLSFPSFFDEQPIEVSVTRLSGDLDPGTRSMMIEADVENRQLKWIPGMFGRATIMGSETIPSGMLPARAVRFGETGNAYVYIVRGDDTVSVTPVTTGADDGHMIQILAGVSPGERVIDAHLRRFAEGQQVRPIAED